MDNLITPEFSSIHLPTSKKKNTWPSATSTSQRSGSESKTPRLSKVSSHRPARWLCPSSAMRNTASAENGWARGASALRTYGETSDIRILCMYCTYCVYIIHCHALCMSLFTYIYIYIYTHTATGSTAEYSSVAGTLCEGDTFQQNIDI